ncbi:MAG: acetate--CoA ligase family protein [Candidatus Aminicenantes bacterium]|nr:acetate--CoA ligase family protein [Candidatus Aminicenantes bacterium]
MDKSFETAAGLFRRAEREGRNFLLEAEVYDLLEAAGIPAPRRFFVGKDGTPGDRSLEALECAEAVVKVVSPHIQHKTDVGGVAVVPAEARAVASACADMLRSVPERFVRWEEGFESSSKRARSANRKKEVEESIRGFLIVEKVDYEKTGFGQELLLGVRNSREFGPVLTVGAGGLDVEFLGERLKEGEALAMASAHLLEDAGIPRLLAPLAASAKLIRTFRGRPELLSEEHLAETVGRFRDLAAHFSAFEPAHEFVIEEAEVNPFVVRRGRLVPLDGVCRFSRSHGPLESRPAESIRALLRPSSIGIIGVSEKMNLGRIILRNILAKGFPPENVLVVKPGVETIDDCRCFTDVSSMPRAVDLFVLTVSAEQSPAVMKDLAEGEKARTVVIIAGGMGEKKGTEGLEDGISRLILDRRRRGKFAPVVNGGNCMGILSKPGLYDTTFIPAHKMQWPEASSDDRAGLVFVSQSGAYLISRLSKMRGLEPRYAVSLGNQIDLTASDYLQALLDEPESRLFAFYIEGFKTGDGYVLARAVGEAVRKGKQVLIYKAGRSPEGREATSSHTASVAGDYRVCRAVLEAAGAVMAESLLEFESALKGLLFLQGKKVRGRRAAFLSNAGFECVIMSDSLKSEGRGGLELAPLSQATRERLASLLGSLGIDKLQDVRNPLDVTPVADDAVFAECGRAFLEDENVDCAVLSPVPMTPAMQTLPPGSGHNEDIGRRESIVRRLVEVFRSTDKPVAVNIDAGPLYDPMAAALEAEGVPVFRRSDEAVRFLGKFIEGVLARR